MKKKKSSGFTLIELSIVLVIIGLIIGGVLVGRDLISSAATRSQITQIEQYNTAVGVFRDKFGGIPGDIDATRASQGGLITRGNNVGQGDGNGYLEGWGGGYSTDTRRSTWQGMGENVVFWVDLTTANLISDNLTIANNFTEPGNQIANANLYWPKAKIGNGNYVLASGWNGLNYLIVSIPTLPMGNTSTNNATGITVLQAYSVDSKIDDGLPQTGKVLAAGLYGQGLTWSNGDCCTTVPRFFPFGFNAGPNKCFDNNNVANAAGSYSLKQNASAINCGLSFQALF